MRKVLCITAVVCLAFSWGLLYAGGTGAGASDSLLVRKALEAFLPQTATDSSAVDSAVINKNIPATDSSAIDSTAVGEIIPAADSLAIDSTEALIEPDYEFSQGERDSIHRQAEAIRASLGELSGVRQVEVDVRAGKLTDTLFAAESYRAVVYDSLPEPTQPPYANIGHPVRFVLENGLKVIVYPDHTMPIVSFYIGILNQRVFEKEKKGVSDLTAAMLLAGVQNRTKAQITDSLANMGSLYKMTRSSFYVSGLSRYALPNFNLFADVVLRPSFPLQEFFSEKKAMGDSYALSDARPDVVLNRVYRALAFGGRIPSGEFISDASIKNITLNDCQAYYSTYWRPNNAVLLVMGDITPQRVRTMVNSRFRTWTQAPIPQDKISVVNDLPSTSVDFVHDPSARDSRIIISNIAEFDYNSPDVFPAMFINHLMGGDLLANIRATLQATPYSGDVFSLSPDPMGGYMFLLTRVPNMDVVRTIAHKTAQLQRIRTVALTGEQLSDLKQHLIGRIALSFEDRNALGGYGVAVENGTVKKDFLEDILRQISAVTSEDVMRVAQKYIKPSQFRIVIYGDARKVVPPLELARYDVAFYDRYAKRVGRPSLSQPVTDSVTADAVLKNYFEAMGGLRKMRAVTSLRQDYDIMIGDKDFKAEILSRLPYYQQQQIFYDGDIYLKKTFNGNMGYTKVERTRTDLPAAEVDKGRLVRSIFPLLDYQKEGFKADLDSIVPVRGHFTYRLRVTLPSKDLQNYYISTEDHMVLRIENVASPVVRETDDKGNVTKYVPEKISSYSDYDDYKEVEGVKYPFITEVKDDNGKIIWKMTSVSPNVSIPQKVFR